MTPRATRPWLNYLLGVACAGAILAAILVVGPASGSQATVTRTAIAAQGVVQSTVSGSGNLQAAYQLNLGFKTSGTVTNIYVTQGQHVTPGQLLATLDPQSAEVTLEQAKASLQSAEANLAKEEETNGETASAGQSSGAGAGNSATASTASYTAGPEIAATAAAAPATTPPSGSPTTPATTTSTTPASTTPVTQPSTTTAPASATPPSKTTKTPTTPTSERTTTSHVREPTETKSNSNSESSSSSSATLSTATREANLASARAAVKQRQADGAERRTGGSEHQALRARGRHDRLALRSGRRNRLRRRNDQSLEQQQLLERIGDGRGRDGRRLHGCPLRGRLVELVRIIQLLRLVRALRSRSSAISARCSSWCR